GGCEWCGNDLSQDQVEQGLAQRDSFPPLVLPGSRGLPLLLPAFEPSHFCLVGLGATPMPEMRRAQGKDGRVVVRAARGAGGVLRPPDQAFLACPALRMPPCRTARMRERSSRMLMSASRSPSTTSTSASLPTSSVPRSAS